MPRGEHISTARYDLAAGALLFHLGFAEAHQVELESLEALLLEVVAAEDVRHEDHHHDGHHEVLVHIGRGDEPVMLGVISVENLLPETRLSPLNIFQQ